MVMVQTIPLTERFDKLFISLHPVLRVNLLHLGLQEKRVRRPRSNNLYHIYVLRPNLKNLNRVAEPPNRFKLSAVWNLEILNTITNGTNHVSASICISAWRLYKSIFTCSCKSCMYKVLVSVYFKWFVNAAMY